MKNGNRKVRNYILRSQKAKELYNKLYATREFKKNIYSLYTRDYNDIKEITWSGIETEYLNLTKEEKKQFFDTYLSELDGLSRCTKNSSRRKYRYINRWNNGK